MAQLPPAPVGTPFGSYAWADWYYKITYTLNNSQFEHNKLEGLQGGSASERYHLTLEQYNKVANAMSIKRIIREKITFSGASATYTIAPAVTPGKTLLTHLGHTTAYTTSPIFTRIELTNPTTVTVFKDITGAGTSCTVSFELVEYN